MRFERRLSLVELHKVITFPLKWPQKGNGKGKWGPTHTHRLVLCSSSLWLQYGKIILRWLNHVKKKCKNEAAILAIFQKSNRREEEGACRDLCMLSSAVNVTTCHRTHFTYVTAGLNLNCLCEGITATIILLQLRDILHQD